MTLDDCPRVDLSPIWGWIDAVAAVRYAHMPKGVREWGDVRHIEAVGVAGEVGVALITGRPVNFRPFDGSDGGSDIAGVDVKTTGHWPPILKQRRGAKWAAEWYALAHVSAVHVVTYIGCVSVDDFRRLGYEANFGYGPTLCLDADEVLRMTLARRARPPVHPGQMTVDEVLP